MYQSSTIYTRIEQLQPRIQRAAAVRAAGDLDADDQAQNMILAILENQRPDLAEQTDAYIVQCGDLYGARPAQKKELRYASHMLEVTAPEDCDDDIIEVFPDGGATPEEEVSRRETTRAIIEAIRELSPENQKMIYFMAAGFSQTEIADRCGVSPAAISQRKNTIKKMLATRI